MSQTTEHTAPENTGKFAPAVTTPPTQPVFPPLTPPLALTTSLSRLVSCFETLTPATVGRFGDYYAADARFKDPFNDVTGLPAIKRIFSHMFEQLDAPRFIVTGRYLGDGVAAGEAMLCWELRFRLRSLGSGEQTIVGSTRLCFDAAGKVTLHRDYWDASEELFSKLPIIGPLTRALRQKLAAR